MNLLNINPKTAITFGIATLIMAIMSFSALAAAPVTNTSTILPATAYTTTTLQGWCNATDADGDNVTYEYQWYLDGVANETGTLNDWCYQENAETATSCGGLSGGSYTSTGTWLGFAITHDDDWTNYGYARDVAAQGYVTYKIPNGSTIEGFRWSVKTFVSTINISLTSSCKFNGTDLELKYESQRTGEFISYFSKYYCKDLADVSWVLLESLEGSSAYAYIADEAAYWYIPQPVSESNDTNIANISTSSTSKNQNWTFSCRAYDGTNYSSWLNSSTLTISNSKPTISDITFNTPVYLGQTASATWTFTDADSDSDTSYYRWYIDGVLNSSGQYNGTALTFANFDNDGENITFSILGNDGTDNSTAWVNSSFLVQDVNLTAKVNSETSYNYTMAMDDSTTFTLKLTQDQNTTLAYNLTDNHNASFIAGISYSSNPFNVTNTTVTEIIVTLNTSNVTGEQTFNITVTREMDGKTVTFPVTIRVSPSSAVLTISPTTTWLLSMYNDQTNERTITVSNTGYNASECNFVASDAMDSYLTNTEFSVANGSSVNVTVTIVNPVIDLYDGSIRVQCDNATNEGYPAYSNSFDYTIISSSPPAVGGGGGGGGFYVETVDNETLDKLIEAKLRGKALIQWSFPGHERIINFLPTSDFVKEVYFTVGAGPAEIVSVVFSSDIAGYFEYTICNPTDLKCRQIVPSMATEENRYVLMQGNLSNPDFLADFLDDGKVSGSVYLMSGDQVISPPYNITIQKSRLYDVTHDIAERFGSLTHKAAYYFTLVAILCGCLIAGSFVLRIAGIV